MTLGYDPARADQIALLAASRALARRAIKFALPGSGYAYRYGTVTLSPVPNFNGNGVLNGRWPSPSTACSPVLTLPPRRRHRAPPAGERMAYKLAVGEFIEFPSR